MVSAPRSYDSKYDLAQQRHRISGWLRTLLLAVAMTVGVATLASTVAAAPSPYLWNTEGSAINICRETGCTSWFNRASNGTAFTMYCWKDAQWAYGNGGWSNRWFYGRAWTQAGPMDRWVSARFVQAQTSVGYCYGM
jgi:hypothetical protein